MKRRKFLPSSLIHCSALRYSTTTSHSVTKQSEDSIHNRVEVLPRSTSDFVRAGQVIGSSYRAIEELVHNSVIHGRAREIDITLGTVGASGTTTFLKVVDDGIGIDEVSTRDHIGTRHCSSQIYFKDGESAQIKSYCKGETLKALASLSVEFRIFTTCTVKRIEDENKSSVEKETPSYSRRKLVASAPAKPRKRRKRDCSLDDSTGQRSQQKAPTTTTISMEKIVRDNEIFLFRSVPNKNFVKHTGTSIELFGLFHKHHVRLKQHQQMLQDGNHHVPWSKVRSCVQLLAMAYPHVTIRLYSTKHPAPDTVWVQSASVAKIGPSIDTNRFSMHPLYTMAMKQRLLHLNHGVDGDINNGAFLRVFYSESYNSDDRQFSSKDLTKDKRLAAVINSRQESRKKWVICGMLYEILLLPSNKCESLSSTKNTSKENGFIFVNGRLYKHQSALLDLVLNICHNHESSKASSQWSFLLHILCPSSDVNLLHDDVRSYSVVGQRNRLMDLISSAIRYTFHENSKCKKMMTYDQKTAASPHPTNAKVSNFSSSNSTASLLYRSTRIISGEQLKKRKYDERGRDKVDDSSSISNKNDISRDYIFDDAFSLQTKKCEEHLMSPKTKATDNINHEEHTRLANRTNPSKLGMTWTKSKLKALDTQIASLTNASKSDHPIVITKDMLLKAEHVAQLDSKFIVVNMCGTLCLVDQHAADERVGLERLEKALHKNLSSSDNKQQYCDSFDLSKLKNIRTDQLVKRTPLQNPKSIEISPFLSSVIANCENIIKKWNFDFDHDSVRHKVLLKSYPSICDRVAIEKDFIQFVQLLGHQTTNALSTAQPAFVKRTLASYACRYAIMFGDVLDDDQCRSLLSNLSKCELCFICAHGRPSIVPLIDLNLMPCNGGYIQQSSSSFRGKLPNNTHREERIPIRFRHLYQQNQKTFGSSTRK